MVSILVLPLALIGFIISWYIFYKKIRHEELICELGDDCNKVIYSKYNKIFGFPNEILGMSYYALVMAMAIIAILWTESIGTLSTSFILIVITTIASLFSLFLIYIQAFVIKEWCEYCLISAGITFLILIAEIINIVL